MNSLQLQFLILICAGWVNRSQQAVIEYLQEEEAAELPSKPGASRAPGWKAPAVHKSSAPTSRSQGKGNRGGPSPLALRRRATSRSPRAFRDQHTRDAEHYHLERNHQGLDNELIEKLIDEPKMEGAVECRERLGGILKYYHRRAA